MEVHLSKKVKIFVEYVGAGYHGMQSQPPSPHSDNRYNKGDYMPTIQAEIENILLKVLKLRIKINFAGRTDTGVHALGQVIDFNIPTECCIKSLTRSLNFFLNRKGISFYNPSEVGEGFHSRFSAKSRTYEYHIINRDSPSVTNPHQWHIYQDVDWSRVSNACDMFLGKHDFSLFRSKFCSSNRVVRTLDVCEIRVNGSNVVFTLGARAFLHAMVRNIVGCCISYGIGRFENQYIIDALKGLKSRQEIKWRIAPPDGLFLHSVEY